MLCRRVRIFPTSAAAIALEYRALHGFQAHSHIRPATVLDSGPREVLVMTSTHRSSRRRIGPLAPVEYRIIVNLRTLSRRQQHYFDTIIDAAARVLRADNPTDPASTPPSRRVL
jgi:hypothetical protein